MQQLMSEPLWDEGLSSFLYGEYEKRKTPLNLDDLRAFANENAVRIGDLLETLFLMSIYGEWKYTNTDGEDQMLDEDALNELYARGRLTDKDQAAFSGVWQPA